MKRIQIANAPCSWGVMAGFDEALFPPYERVLDQIAETGYTGTELGDWGFLPTDHETLWSQLKARGLMVVGALVPVAFADARQHRAGVEASLRTARLLASCACEGQVGPFLILTDANGIEPLRVKNAGRIKPEHGLSAEQWRTFAAGVNLVARAVQEETGLSAVFHHHCAGYVETPDEIAELMERTDAALVGLCFDTGHYAYGGGDALEGLRRFRARVRHVHFKDFYPRVAERARREGWDYFQAVAGGVFYGLGGGEVDFAALLRELEATGYRGWVVVEDEIAPGAGDPRERARLDREYLRGLGL
jgi:inosose dehydratase